MGRIDECAHRGAMTGCAVARHPAATYSRGRTLSTNDASAIRCTGTTALSGRGAYTCGNGPPPSAAPHRASGHRPTQPRVPVLCEHPRGRAAHLLPGGAVDEPAAPVERRAVEAPGSLELGPLRVGDREPPTVARVVRGRDRDPHLAVRPRVRPPRRRESGTPAGHVTFSPPGAPTRSGRASLRERPKAQGETALFSTGSGLGSTNRLHPRHRSVPRVDPSPDAPPVGERQRASARHGETKQDRPFSWVPRSEANRPACGGSSRT
jgi:hypothetical protein